MYYSVANFQFRVILPEGRDADMLLPSFRPFHVSEDGGPVLFTLKVFSGERLAVSGERESLRSGEGSASSALTVSGERLAVSGIKGEGSASRGLTLSAHRSPAHPLTLPNDPLTTHLSPANPAESHPLTAHRSPAHPAEGHPLTAHRSPLTRPKAPPLLEDENDMGHLRLYNHPTGYMLTLSYGEKGPQHILLTDKAFTSPTAYVWWEDPDISMVLTSMLRIVYSQAILPHGAVSLHASVVTNGGRGYLFMGVSGTGKSTHSRLWMEHVPGSELLNDDNPIIRLMEEGMPYVFGSPWSGKTPCYKAHGVPVGGMAQLQQAPMNRFHEQDPISAFSLVLPGCSVVRADEHLFNALCDTLAEICTVVKVGLLECLPDRNAALQCAEYLKKVNI